MVENPMRTRRRADQTGWKWFGWLLDLVVLILLTAAIPTGKHLLRMEGRMAVSEQNQKHLLTMFTTVQAQNADLLTQFQEMKLWQAQTHSDHFRVEDGKEIWAEIAEIKEAVATLPYFAAEIKALRQEWMAYRLAGDG